MSVLNSSTYCYRLYGINLQINHKLAQFTALSSLDCSLKVDLSFLDPPQESNYLAFKDLDWSTIPESNTIPDLFLAKAIEGSQTYYKFNRRIDRGFIEYIFNSTGDRVWGFYSDKSLLQDTISLLLGFVLGNVIRMRGHLAFHASAIAVEGGAILLTGDSGAGKSTTAAALSDRGCKILADDIAVLDERSDGYWVQPGYPGLRLFPESVKVFDTSVKELARVSAFGSKRYLDLTSDGEGKHCFQTQPLPLIGIYIMGQRDKRRDRSTVEPLASASAMTHLVKSVYGSYFLSKEYRAEEFKQLGRFARKTPVRQLSRANELQNLAQLCQLIVEDTKSLIYIS